MVKKGGQKRKEPHADVPFHEPVASDNDAHEQMDHDDMRSRCEFDQGSREKERVEHSRAEGATIREKRRLGEFLTSGAKFVAPACVGDNSTTVRASRAASAGALDAIRRDATPLLQPFVRRSVGGETANVALPSQLADYLILGTS